MNKMFEKATILAVAMLFISILAMPVIVAEKQTQQRTFPVELSSVQSDGTIKTEIYQLSNGDLASLLEKLQNLLDLLNGVTDKNKLLDLLLELLRGEGNPIISKILQNLIDSNFALDSNLVMSCGFGYNLNPFKELKTEIIKPIVFWQYSSMNEVMQIPSTTAIVKFNPFKLQTSMGSQFGFMFRFKGIYVHVPQQYPMQSFTFFIGTAKRVINIELPNVNVPTIDGS